MKPNIKLILFIINGIVAIWFAFFAFDIPTMIINYQKAIYWFLTISLFLFITSIIDILSYDNSQTIEFYFLFFLKKTYSFSKYHSLAIVLSFLLMIFASNICKPYFRVLADETNILSISQSLYQSRESYLTMSSFEYPSGQKDVLEAKLEKRPAFFSYLLYIVHSLIGYRVNNIFIFNFINGFLSLFLIYYLIQIFEGRIWGIIGMLCLASYPLFVYYTTSSGFEVFNMMCSLIFFLILYKYIKSPDAKKGELFLLWIPLLAQSRYESVLTLLIALPVFAYLLPKNEYKNLSYKFIVYPLLFVAPAWLRVVTNSPYYWQLNNMNEGFGFYWLKVNLKKAFSFFFSGEDAFGIVNLYSILAVLGIIWFIINSFIILFKKEENNNNENYFGMNDKKSFLVLSISIFSFYVLHALIRFIYSWIDLTSPIIMRLGIIFLPLFIIMTIYFIKHLTNLFKIRKVYLIPFFVFILFVYWPKSVKMANLAFNNYELLLNMKTSLQFLEKNFPDKQQYIIVNSNPNLFTPFGYNAVRIDRLDDSYKYLVNYTKDKYCSFFLVFQIVDKETDSLKNSYEKINNEYWDILDVFKLKLLNNNILKISKSVLNNNISNIGKENTKENL